MILERISSSVLSPHRQEERQSPLAAVFVKVRARETPRALRLASLTTLRLRREF